MAKILELIGLGFVAIMTIGFVGGLQTFGIRPGTSELFWGCAGTALIIIIYGKIKRKQAKETQEKS